MAESLLPRRTINKQEYVLLADVTVETATTSVDITGLNIGKEEEIVLVSDIYNSAGSSADMSLYFNAKYTSTNYYRQYLYASSTTIIAQRYNMSVLANVASGQKSLVIANIKLTNNGYNVWQSNATTTYGGSGVLIYQEYNTSTFTATSITSLRIASSVSSAIGIGSRFQLYKVGA